MKKKRVFKKTTKVNRRGKDCFRDLCFLLMGFFGALYYAILIVEGNETVASFLLIPFVLLAMVLFVGIIFNTEIRYEEVDE